MWLSRGNGWFVVPGDRLGVIEEFIAGQGTYIEDGGIYSAATGYVLLDRTNKVASVDPKTRILLVPRIGNLVLGQVTQVQEKSATIRILKIGDEVSTSSFSGIIHISNASLSYIRSMHRVFKPGDYVRAEVVSTKNRTFHLSTEGEKFGVVQALCSHCGRTLELTDRGLACNSCGSREERKIASDFGKASA